MSDLISRSALIEALENLRQRNPHSDARSRSQHNSEITSCIHRVMMQPTVDAKPVVHGEWIRQKNSVGSWTHPTYKCSICGNGSNTDAKFCSECGSSMEQWVNGKSKWE